MMGRREAKLFRAIYGPRWRMVTGPEWLLVSTSTVQGKKARHIAFYFKENSWVDIRLTGQEWRRLYDFLKKTKDSRFLPKGCEGIEGYNIDSNEIDFFSSKDIYSRLEKRCGCAVEGIRRYKGKDQRILRERRFLRWVTKQLKIFKKYPVVGRGMVFEKSGTTIFFDHRRFVGFRGEFIRKVEETDKGKKK